MASVADIWNMALGQIGNGNEITDPDTETSKEAAACRAYWPTIRDEVLRDFPWPRLTVTAILQLVADNTAIQYAPWRYTYRVPSNCAAVRRVLHPYSRLETDATVVPYQLGRDASGDLLFCDLQNASVEYTLLETQAARYMPDVVTAMALRLAGAIAPRFGPDAVKLGDRALRLYLAAIAKARANAGNEVEYDRTDDSSFLSSRG